jgi:hypothetical protein
MATTGGGAVFANLGTGISDLDFIFQVGTSTNGGETNIDTPFLSLPIEIVTNLAPGMVDVKIDPDPTQPIVILLPPPKPPCNCTCIPWAGVMGGDVNGVQKVSVAGGEYPGPRAKKPCNDCGLPPLVTVTGPNVNVVLPPGKHLTFSPAADGVWTVTTTVCTLTVHATITLP